MKKFRLMHMKHIWFKSTFLCSVELWDLFNNCPPPLQKGWLFLNRIWASHLLTSQRRLITFHECTYYVRLNRIKYAMVWQLGCWILEYNMYNPTTQQQSNYNCNPTATRCNDKQLQLQLQRPQIKRHSVQEGPLYYPKRVSGSFAFQPKRQVC